MKMDPEFIGSINDKDNDSSATETCSDPGFFKESDEELSDNEEEREQFIFRYPLKSTVKKEMNYISSDPLCVNDPFEQVNKDVAIKNVACRYCSYSCDSDYILFTHIDQKHKNRSSYTCNFPFCNFKASNMLEWITHKGKCKNNPDALKSESPKRSKLSDTNRKKQKNSELNVNPEVQKTEYLEENDITQKGKTPIIKVKPDYKLKSPEFQELLILDEPREASNVIVKLEPSESQETLIQDKPRESSNVKLKSPELQESLILDELREPSNVRLKSPELQESLILDEPREPSNVKLKSPELQESLILDEPREPSNLIIKLKPPGIKLFKNANQSLLKKLNSSNSNACKRHVKTPDSLCYNCGKMNLIRKNNTICTPFINPFGDDLLFRIRRESDNHGQNDHSYSRIDFFQRLGLNKLKNGSCRQALLKTITHLKSKLDHKLLRFTRAYPEQLILLQIIQQLEEVKLYYYSPEETKSRCVPETATAKKSNNKKENVGQNNKPVVLAKIPLGCSSKKKFKLLIPKKNMEKILLDSDAKLVIDGHVSSVNNLRKILPKKKLLAKKKCSHNVSSHELLTQAEPTLSVEQLPSNIKQNNSNNGEQSLSLNNKIDETELNSEEMPSFVRDSSNLKRKNCISNDDEEVEEKITSSSRKIVKNKGNIRTVSEEFSKENVSDTNQTNNIPKEDQFEVKKEGLDESDLDSNKSLSAVEPNKVVPLVHTCRRGKRRARPKWSRKKAVKSICHACVEEKFQDKNSFV